MSSLTIQHWVVVAKIDLSEKCSNTSPHLLCLQKREKSQRIPAASTADRSTASLEV